MDTDAPLQEPLAEPLVGRGGSVPSSAFICVYLRFRNLNATPTGRKRPDSPRNTAPIPSVAATFVCVLPEG